MRNITLLVLLTLSAISMTYGGKKKHEPNGFVYYSTTFSKLSTSTTVSPRTTNGTSPTSFPRTTNGTSPTSFPRTTFYPQTTSSPSNLCDADYSCLDCSTVRICAPTDNGHSLQEVDRFTCPPRTPWCSPSSGVCTAEKPDGCDAAYPVPGMFLCMRDGYYPDVTNCSRYFRCDEDVPYLNECPTTKPYYSPVSQDCDLYQSNCANLRTVCSDSDGIKTPIRNTDNMFAYCVNSTAFTVDRCIGGYVFNSTAQTCQAHCPHAGLFPSDLDCTKYYRCSPADREETTFTMTLDLSCPQGQGFLESAYQCVDRLSVPNCNVTSPALFN